MLGAKSDKFIQRQHFFYPFCGLWVDYGDFMERETKFIKELETELSKKYKFKINSHQIHFYGLCQNCQRR